MLPSVGEFPAATAVAEDVFAPDAPISDVAADPGNS